MKISVLVTTFGRRDYLERCVDSLLAQERSPDEVVIVTRVGDSETEGFVKDRIASYRGPVRLLHARVAEPGVLAANRAGMAGVTGDIVSFIDDDAAARPDWLRRIETHFLGDSRLGAVGGRDVQHTEAGSREEKTDDVGRICWYGRIVGNHHKISRGIREVDHLKGVNMSFKRELIAPFDDRILGNAHYYEMDLCLGVRRRGFRVLYDGDLLVDHYVGAPRYLPGSQAGGLIDREYFVHHNRVYVMMKHLPAARRVVFLAYTFVRDGLVGAIKIARGSSDTSLRILAAAYRGKLAGLRDYLRAGGPREPGAEHAARSRG